jgi:hypothetical protein
VLRAGRRRRWISDTLQTLPGRRSARQQRRLEAALALVMGMEAMVILRDICQLEPDEAVEVSKAAAEAILLQLA